MKTCEQYAELLPALAEDVLAAGEAAEVRAHVSTCASCAESWRLQELISQHVRETELADKPDYFWTKQRKHILAEVGFGTSRFEVARPQGRPLLRFALAAAAAAVLVVGSLVLLRTSDTPPSNGGGVAKDEGQKPVKDPPVVKDEPKKPDETPEPPPFHEGLGHKPEPEKPVEPPPPPQDDPVVDNPDPKDEPKKDKPKEDVVKGQPVPPKDPPPKAPPKEDPIPHPEPVVILPGHERYSIRLAMEQVEILLPLDSLKTPVVKERDTNEQALAALKASRARLEDIRLMLARDPKADITEMVDAYALLVGEGVGSVLFRMAASDKSVLPSRHELRAQAALLEAFPEDLKKGSLQPAIQACAAALQSRGRRHTPRSSKESDSGALASAREAVQLLTLQASGPGILALRTRVGFAAVGRFQIDMLEHANKGRVAETEGGFEAYQWMVDGMIRMLELLDTKDATQVCALARADLRTCLSRFGTFKGPESTKPIVVNAGFWTSTMLQRVVDLESYFQGKTPRPPKRDPVPPPAPPASNPPAPPAPPFGETPPPSPPPAPPPPFGEDPK